MKKEKQKRSTSKSTCQGKRYWGKVEETKGAHEKMR